MYIIHVKYFIVTSGWVWWVRHSLIIKPRKQAPCPHLIDTDTEGGLTGCLMNTAGEYRVPYSFKGTMLPPAFKIMSSAAHASFMGRSLWTLLQQWGSRFRASLTCTSFMCSREQQTELKLFASVIGLNYWQTEHWMHAWRMWSLLRQKYPMKFITVVIKQENDTSGQIQVLNFCLLASS